MLPGLQNRRSDPSGSLLLISVSLVESLSIKTLAIKTPAIITLVIK
ncbi:hypothetical protein A33I_12935 [Alkalihalophilus marmarensis DSM 21297]|uniref:Uncharacterized protein n=1 Tax=Alkalihalophilus marmarensis DSM 21297 TaxID=1188261 RepID=U6SND7_9BACI|nr:hypothetical protein A33I_12935 [Alkalihalophilus marmarensis DSM 21297]